MDEQYLQEEVERLADKYGYSVEEWLEGMIEGEKHRGERMQKVVTILQKELYG